MRVMYEAEASASSISFRETTVTTRQLDEGTAADIDAQGRLAGIAILDAVQRLGGLGRTATSRDRGHRPRRTGRVLT